MHFDARVAKALEADAYIVIDGCQGLRLVASNSCKSWIYRYKSPIDGRMRQFKIGEWPDISFPSAVAEWESLRGQRDTGRDPSLERKSKRKEKQIQATLAKEGVYTVERLVEDYIAEYVTHHRIPANAKALASRLRRGIAQIASLEPSCVTRSVAFDLVQRLADTPMAAASVKQELGAAWEFAYDRGRLSEDVPNWWRQIMKGRLQSKGALRDGVHKGTDKRVLTEEEIGRLIVKDYALLSPPIQDVLTLYLWTAARGSEICALHADHISEEDGVLWATLLKSETKNRKRVAATDFRFPLVGRAESAIRARLEANPGGFLFPGRHASGHIQQTNVQTQVHSKQPYSKTRPDWQRQRLSVTRWSPHDLRRTSRTLLAKIGCPNEVGEAILGHVTPGVAGVYNRYKYDVEKLQWLQRLSERLEAIVQDAHRDGD